jgi:hypothetical protein
MTHCATTNTSNTLIFTRRMEPYIGNKEIGVCANTVVSGESLVNTNRIIIVACSEVHDDNEQVIPRVSDKF